MYETTKTKRGMKFKNGIEQYIAVIVGIGLSTITLMITVIVISAMRDSQPANSMAYNVTNAGLTLFSGVTSQFGTIGTISGVLLLAAIVMGFGMGGYMLYRRTQ